MPIFSGPLTLSRAPFLCLSLLLPAAVAGLVPRTVAAPPPVPAVPAIRASDFLDSIGTQSAISVRGESLPRTLECIQYLGVGWMRGGVEGDVPIQEFVELHQKTGVRFSWGLGSGGTNIPKLIATGKQIAAAGALLAFEGPNEPNNWGITYPDENGKEQVGGRDKSWVPVARLQSDLYKAVKSEPSLKKYPVWSITESGAQTDNVGLQYLKIPKGAGTVMPEGTTYADYANVHNYFYHPNSAGVEDNKTWNAADPTSACKVDGLYGNYGSTWARHYPGYSEADLWKLPRVTTETGTVIQGEITEEIHALNLLSLYLDQFKRGWSYTCNYLMRDRVDEAGNQTFGFFRPDYTPRKAAVYLHNLTTVLRAGEKTTGGKSPAKPGKLAYQIPAPPATVHDMLLQKSNGTFALIVWDERVKGSDDIQVRLGKKAGSVVIYDPTVGVDPVRTEHGIDTLPLTLSNHPLILIISDERR